MKIMKIIKKTLTGACIGITIGMVFSIFFSKLYGISYLPSTPRFINHFNGLTDAVLVSIILWALMGILWTLCHEIFRIQSWSLLKQTVVHFVVSYVGYTILAILCGWFPMGWLIGYTIIFVIAYVIFWLIAMINTRNNVKKINQTLNERN